MFFFAVIESQRAHNVRNWHNIWTTLSPPTSPKPTHARRLSVVDTIRAAAEASKRLYSSSATYTEKVVKPIRFINKSSHPTHESRRQTSSNGYVRNSKITLGQAQDRSYSHYAEPQPVRPTAQTNFSQHRQPNILDIGMNQMAGSSPNRYGHTSHLKHVNTKSDFKSRRPEFSLNGDSLMGHSGINTNNLKYNSISDPFGRDLGSSRNEHVQQVKGGKVASLMDESSMFDTVPNSHTAVNQYGVKVDVGKNPIALFAVDGFSHGVDSLTPSNTYSATNPPVHRAATVHTKNSVTRRPRYGKSTPRNRYSDQRKTTEQQRFKVLPNGSIVDYGYLARRRLVKTPTRASSVTRATRPPHIFITGTAKNQMVTASALTTRKQHTQDPHTKISPKVTILPVARPTTSRQQIIIHTSSTPSLGALKSTKLPTTKQRYVNPSGGISVVDMYNFTTDYYGTRNNSSSLVTNDLYGFNTNMAYQPSSTTKWNTTQKPTTLAPQSSTTTPARTTTTPQITTMHRRGQDDYFLKNGGSKYLSF